MQVNTATRNMAREVRQLTRRNSIPYDDAP